MFVLNRENMDFPLPEINYKPGNRYVIYGTGEVAGSYYRSICELYGENSIAFFLDSLVKKDELYGKKVISPKELANRADKNVLYYLLASYTSSNSMEAELLNNGVNQSNIISNNKYSIDSFDKLQGTIKSIGIFPPIDDSDVLNDLLSKIELYIPDIKSSLVKIKLIYKKDDHIHKNLWIDIKQEGWNVDDTDLILVWNKKALGDEILKKHPNVYCIDPEFFQLIDTKILGLLNYKILNQSSKSKYLDNSYRFFNKLDEQFKDTETSFIFGLGPSLRQGISKFIDMNIPKSVRIACNGCINSPDLMDKIKPNVYILTDIQILQHDMMLQMDTIAKYINNNDCYLIVNEWWIPIIVARYPFVSDKIIGITENAEHIMFPSPEHRQVYAKAHNVITRMAVPLASYLTDTIYITGCDGVQIEEEGQQAFTYTEGVNTHKDISQKKQSITYFIQHNSFFKDIIEYGEKLGKQYYSLTSSYIPVLQERLFES
ncbi:MAG: hypothetical protein PHF63_02825 [Herbinix sp.]|nr:hypothetical protein [Herbinix sp.]